MPVLFAYVDIYLFILSASLQSQSAIIFSPRDLLLALGLPF
jgi:hypothetical protein